MDALLLLLIFVAFWASTNFWLVPLVHGSWTRGDVAAKVKRAATLTVLEKVRDLTGAGAVALVLVTLLVGFASLLGEGSAVLSRQVMDELSSAYRAVNAFASGYARFLLWFGVVTGGIVLFLSARTARRRVSDAWKAEAGRVRVSLETDSEAREALRKDPDFRYQSERLDKLDRLLVEPETAESPARAAALRYEAAGLLDEVAAEMSRRTLDLEAALGGGGKPEAASDAPKTKLQLIASIIGGPRLSKDLGLIGRYLTMLLVALLLVALTGWSATRLANSLRVTVNELRVSAMTDDVERAVDEAIARIEPEAVQDDGKETADPAALTRAARLVAQAAVHRFQNSGLLEPRGGAGARTSRAEFVRAAILNRPLEAGGRTTAAESLRLQVAERMQAGGTGGRAAAGSLVGRVERDVGEILRSVQARSPRAVDRVVDRVLRRYGTSLSPLDVQGSLISRLATASLDVVDVNVADDLGKVAKGLTADVGKSVVGEWADLHARAIVADGLLGERARTDVMRHLEGGGWLERSQRTSELLDELQRARGKGWAPSAMEQASERTSKAVADAVARRYVADVGPTIQRMLRGYSSAFPRVAGAAAQASNLGSFATDFARAVRSSWVRGVIFGREVTPGFRVTDIRWGIESRAEGATLLTFFVRVDGSELSLGSFAAGVVNQALRFAADRRVVATTITGGDGAVIERVTHLHPVLEDTPLGCRVVEVDRIIDTFTDEEAVDGPLGAISGQLTAVISHRQAMSRFLEIAELAQDAAQSGQQCEKESFVPGEDEAASTAIEIDGEMAGRVLGGLDGKRGSTALVAAALQCGREWPAVRKCLCDNVGEVDLSSPYWLPVDLTSQVRERDASGEETFDALFRPAQPSDSIELWLHTTFAVHVDGEVVGDDRDTVALDFPEDLIEELNSTVVPDGVAKYAERIAGAMGYGNFMAPIEQFVLVQRFMRAALDGQLGGAFPLTKLVELERATARYVPTQRTVRWEFADEEEILPVLLASGDEAWDAFFEWIEDARRRIEEDLPLCDAVSH